MPGRLLRARAASLLVGGACRGPSSRVVGALVLALDRLPPRVLQPLNPLVARVAHGQQAVVAWVKFSTVCYWVHVVWNVRQRRAPLQFAYNAKRVHSLVRPCEPGPPAVVSSCCCRCPVVFSAGAITHATATVANQSAATGLSTRVGACKGHGLIASVWQRSTVREAPSSALLCQTVSVGTTPHPRPREPLR